MQTACDRAGKTDPEHPNPRPGLPAHLPMLKHRLGKARSPIPTFRSPLALCQQPVPGCARPASIVPAPHGCSCSGAAPARGLLRGALSVVPAQGSDLPPAQPHHLLAWQNRRESQTTPSPPAREKSRDFTTYSSSAEAARDLSMEIWHGNAFHCTRVPEHSHEKLLLISRRLGKAARPAQPRSAPRLVLPVPIPVAIPIPVAVAAAAAVPVPVALPGRAAPRSRGRSLSGAGPGRAQRRHRRSRGAIYGRRRAEPA